MRRYNGQQTKVNTYNIKDTAVQKIKHDVRENVVRSFNSLFLSYCGDLRLRHLDHARYDARTQKSAFEKLKNKQKSDKVRSQLATMSHRHKMS